MKQFDAVRFEEMKHEIEALVPGIQPTMTMSEAMELILAELKRLKAFESANGR